MTELDRDQMRTVFIEGIDAREQGKKTSECPYELNSPPYFWWNNGWLKYNSFLEVFDKV